VGKKPALPYLRKIQFFIVKNSFVWIILCIFRSLIVQFYSFKYTAAAVATAAAAATTTTTTTTTWPILRVPQQRKLPKKNFRGLVQ